jgi:hypothetical protein
MAALDQPPLMQCEVDIQQDRQRLFEGSVGGRHVVMKNRRVRLCRIQGARRGLNMADSTS